MFILFLMVSFVVIVTGCVAACYREFGIVFPEDVKQAVSLWVATMSLALLASALFSL